MRHVFTTMGTVASIEIPADHGGLLPMIEETFREIDARFSLYRADSELSRIAGGSLALTSASATLRASYERANEWRISTAGLFSSQRPDGVLDLNGIVKAEAIERAGKLLDAAGCPTWAINVGGDMLVRTTASQPAIMGVADPSSPDTLLCSVTLAGDRRALASSGSAQRGDHIWRGGELNPTHFIQVSVIAADIVTADVLATAIVAGGPEALDGITDRWAIDVLAVDRNGSLLATPGFRAALSVAR